MKTKKLKYTRNCPICNYIIEYKDYKSLYQAKFKKYSCRKCGYIKSSDKNRKFLEYKRRCPLCDKEMKYKNYHSWHGAKKNNSVCMECRKIKLREKNIQQFINGMPVTTKEKIRKTLKKKFNTEKYKKKFTKQNSGKNNPMFGKKHTKETKQKCRKMALNQFKFGMPIETKNKISKSLLNSEKFQNSVRSIDRRRKIRLKRIKWIEENKNNGTQIMPNYNTIACKLIDNYGQKYGYNFQHAMNGGEHYIPELGYWVDGYDKEKNTAIEIDERKHFDIDGNLKQKDVLRQQEIENYLKCKFIRIKI